MPRHVPFKEIGDAPVPTVGYATLHVDTSNQLIFQNDTGGTEIVADGTGAGGGGAFGNAASTVTSNDPFTDFYLADAASDSTPTGATVHGQDASGSNVHAAGITFQSGLGTGTGTSGSIVFNAGIQGTSPGSTPNTALTVLTIGAGVGGGSEAVGTVTLNNADTGADITGPQLHIGRNSNASQPSAGSIRFTDKSGTNYWIWVDDGGEMRIDTTAPKNTNDTPAAGWMPSTYLTFELGTGGGSTYFTQNDAGSSSGGNGIGTIAVGSSITVQNNGHRGCLLGGASQISGSTNHAVVVGYSSTAAHSDVVLLGAPGITSTSANQMIVGGNNLGIGHITTLILGGRGDTYATPDDVSWRISNGTGTDVNGGDLSIAASMGTGAGTPGIINMKVGRTLGTGTTLQTATTSFQIGELFVDLPSEDTGNDVTGPQLRIGRNTNGTNSSAGSIRLTDKSGTDYYLYVDDSGVLRIHTSAPTGTNDLSGTVVGSQT